MPEQYCSIPNGGFKEAVCINADRIFDSCSDKDCLVNLNVYFPKSAQCIINEASIVKCGSVTVLDVYLRTEPMPFNKGFYAIDMTFFFRVTLETLQSPTGCPVPVTGLVLFNKKVILYGSEGTVQTFHSDRECGCYSLPPQEPSPRATVQVVQPICLSSRLTNCAPPSIHIPEEIAALFDGSFCEAAPVVHGVQVTLGVFSIVSLARTVQMMVPVYDYCVPTKECQPTNDDPCEMFKQIKFPVNEFFPPRMPEHMPDPPTDPGCGCSDSN